MKRALNIQKFDRYVSKAKSRSVKKLIHTLYVIQLWMEKVKQVIRHIYTYIN